MSKLSDKNEEEKYESKLQQNSNIHTKDFDALDELSILSNYTFFQGYYQIKNQM